MVVMAKAARPVEKTSMVIESADDAEMQQAVAATSAAAGVSVEELRRQAAASAVGVPVVLLAVATRSCTADAHPSSP
jgi:hypothetical protein